MAITKIIQRFYLILFSHLEKQKRAWKKLNPDYITAENAESAEKTVVLQRSLSINPLERSEKDLVLLHLQCNSQKISDFL
jgi:hypothetical protein